LRCELLKQTALAGLVEEHSIPAGVGLGVGAAQSAQHIVLVVEAVAAGRIAAVHFDRSTQRSSSRSKQELSHRSKQELGHRLGLGLGRDQCQCGQVWSGLLPCGGGRCGWL
jgi:hypothetical protein